MKTTPVTPADLAASVLSVPPLARNANYAIDKAENAKLLNHLRGGGVRTFMYGGNANLYNIGVTELRSLAEMLIDLGHDDDWIIPSVGSDFGKAMDQIAVMRDLPFRTVMLLPHKAQSTPAGVAIGIRKLADAYGKPVIAYVKDEGYVEAADMGKLVKDGAVCAIKYAIVRDEPKDDAFLSELVNCVDRSKIISGIGERPAIDHLTKFGLQALRPAASASRRACRWLCCGRSSVTTSRKPSASVRCSSRLKISVTSIHRCACCTMLCGSRVLRTQARCSRI
jgi:dihydrodipicolinate synthase/N-acetylneuraminate lyase